VCVCVKAEFGTFWVCVYYSQDIETLRHCHHHLPPPLISLEYG
jgi:hypothetical protein